MLVQLIEIVISRGEQTSQFPTDWLIIIDQQVSKF